MKTGIAPELVASQIEGTAPWLRADPRAADAVAVIDRVPAIGAALRADPLAPETQLDMLSLLLTAHWCTVATFVPTDVDARIRHHAWMAIEDAALLARACDRVDAVARWDATIVSARVVGSETHGRLSGHDGEWLGVRAGALGRAASLGATDIVERLVADLDREIDRHEAMLVEAFAKDARTALSVATIVAHNLGDLSRVVEAWPGGPQTHAPLRAKYTRLGHADGAPGARRKAFVAAGELNKAIMALENHRFLALRKARCLRRARALLLPIGPWFDDWGVRVATELEANDVADVVTALLELHLSSPDQLGCLRALAGIHRTTRGGGLDALAADVPARLRKEIARGRVREALDVSPEHFAARIEKRFRLHPAHALA